jgi:hypothetical protein
MKLIYCTVCFDIVRLKEHPRLCECGRSGGGYDNEVVAWVSGPCQIYGITNQSFINARQAEDTGPPMPDLQAFRISDKVSSVRRVVEQDNQPAGGE